VLMAPTATAMWQLLAVCDKFAVKFDVMFNASKSKCVLFRPRKTYKYAAMRTPDLFIGGNNIEFVAKWPHLGHMISLNLSDDIDINYRKQSVIGQINTVLCRFGRLDPIVKNKLFQAYCSIHYGSELWDLSCSTRSSIVRPGGEAYDESGNCQIHFVVIICLLFLVLVRYTMSCASVFLILSQLVILVILNLFRFVIKHAVFCARARSPIGRNHALCHKRYGFKVEDELKSGLKSSCRSYEALMHTNTKIQIKIYIAPNSLIKRDRGTGYCHVSFALELIMLRTGISYTPDCEWSRAQIDCMLTAIGTR